MEIERREREAGQLTGWERLVFFNALSESDWEKLASADAILVTGHVCVGKTWVRKGIAKVLNIHHYLLTDEIRSQILFPDSAGFTREERYTPDKSEAVYNYLEEKAVEILKAGEKIILDGTFLDLQKRKEIFALLRGVVGNNFVVVRVSSSEETIKERLAKREEREEEASFSEADYRVYLWFEEKLKRGEFSYPHQEEGIEIVEFENDLEGILRDFGQVKVITWDLDGTLYQSSPMYPKLADLFAFLGSYCHFLLTNNRRIHVLGKLQALGLDPNVFEKIISTYDLGIFKPDKRVFERVLEYTGLPPKQHLCVSDREKTDIAPAGSLGMKTAMVWGRSKMADVSLPEVYDIVKIL